MQRHACGSESAGAIERHSIKRVDARAVVDERTGERGARGALEAAGKSQFFPITRNHLLFSLKRDQREADHDCMADLLQRCTLAPGAGSNETR